MKRNFEGCTTGYRKTDHKRHDKIIRELNIFQLNDKVTIYAGGYPTNTEWKPQGYL